MAEAALNPQPAQPVTVIDPYGNFGTMDPHEVEDAVTNGGFRLPSHTELADFTQKQQYDNPTEALKAFGEGVLSGGTFGASRWLERGMGVPAEAMAAREKYNPVASGGGEVGGVLGSMFIPFLTPVKAVAGLGAAATRAATPLAERVAGMVANKATRPIVNKILSGAAATGLGSAVEASVFGLGQSINESALGDPDALGEHLLPNIGLSAAIGFAAGAPLGGMGALISGVGAKKASAELEKAAIRDEIQTGSLKEATVPANPTSLEEIRAKVNGASFEGINPSDLPQKQALVDALKDVPDLQYPVTGIQLESLSSQKARDYYKAFQESQHEDAQTLRSYEALQKREAQGKLSSEVKSLAPKETLTSDPVHGGEAITRDFVEQYQKEKAELEPLFKRFDNAGSVKLENPEELVNLIERAVPGSAKYLEVTPEGVSLSPYKASMPMGKTVYTGMKDLVEAINDPNMTLGGLRNVRESMRDSINWLSAPRESAQISSLRKSMMDHIEAQVARLEPDLAVRETFKRYAINEGNRETIEKIFGGSISNKASFAKEIKPEDVLNRIFQNTATVKAARDVLGEQVFNKAVGNYLSQHIQQVTDPVKGGFSSNKFGTFLRGKAPELTEAFAGNPQALNRMNSLNTIMRVLPDSPSINPSGTAKTLKILDAMHKLGSIFSPGKAVGEGLEKFAQKVEDSKVHEVMNQMLKGKSVEEAEKAAEARGSKYAILKKLEDAYSSGQKKIVSGAKAVFNAAKTPQPTVPVFFGTKGSGKDEKKKPAELVARINELNNDPAKFLDHLDTSSQSLYAAAPNTAGGYQQALIRATQFLKSKAPALPEAKPLNKPYEYNQSDIAKFNRYLGAVEHPVAVLDQVKSGTLTPEAVETLNAVYPHIYAEMKSALMDEVTNYTSKSNDPLPSKIKMGLSLFLGSDLDDSFGPMAIAQNQMTFMQPSAQPQGVKPTQTGLGHVKQSERALTSMQATAQRERA